MPNFEAKERNPSVVLKPDDGPPKCPNTYLSKGN